MFETPKKLSNVTEDNKSCMWDEGNRTWDVISSLAGIINQAIGTDICDSNYDAHELLVNLKIVSKRTKYDHEYCCCYYYFSSKKSAQNFVDKFNAFIEYVSSTDLTKAVIKGYKDWNKKGVA